MCKINNFDFIKNIQNLTGLGYENSLYELNNFGKSKVIDQLGNLNLNGFRDFGRQQMVSDSSIVKEVCNITGMSYESALIKINMTKI